MLSELIEEKNAEIAELREALQKIQKLAENGVIMSSDSVTGESFHILDALKAITSDALVAK